MRAFRLSDASVFFNPEGETMKLVKFFTVSASASALWLSNMAASFPMAVMFEKPVAVRSTVLTQAM
jgi:hypothetical protein